MTGHPKARHTANLYVWSMIRSDTARLSPVALLILVTLALALTACGGESDTAPTQDPGSGGATTSATSSAAVATTTTTRDTVSAAPDLAGTSWNVTEYVLESGSLTNLWPGTEITLTFEGPGVLAGFSGCNTYQGTYEVSGAYDEFVDGTRDPNDGQAMTITDLSFTEKACESPSNVMSQETGYFAALIQVGRWVVVRGSLSLRAADGFALIFAEPGE